MGVSACMYTHHTTYVLVPTEYRRGHQIPWNLELELQVAIIAQCGCCELNPGLCESMECA